MADNSIPAGPLSPEMAWGQFNQQSFVIQQMLNRLQTATLVQIMAVTNADAVTPVGFVDVLPLVNQVDSDNTATPHTTIHNVPYLRMQGGANAIILDPKVGDIGICIFASRDISKVKSTKKQGNPGSFRKYDWGDGMYIGGMLNGTPSQYVRFSAAGITLHSPTAIILEAPDIQLSASTVEINGSASTTITTPILTVNGAMAVTGVLTAQGTDLHTHTHGGGTIGPGTTGAPL